MSFSWATVFYVIDIASIVLPKDLSPLNTFKLSFAVFEQLAESDRKKAQVKEE